MARKVLFNINNTLLVTINKINQMSDYLGDLDDLNKSSYKLPERSFLRGFQDNEYTENGGLADQSAVAATEWLHRELLKAARSLFGKEGDSSLHDSNDSAEFGVLRFNQVLVADSAVIKRLEVNKLFVPVDSDLSATSATVVRDNLDSNFINTSFEGGPVFNTGLTIDSGYIARFSGADMDIGGRWLVSDSSFRTFFNDSADSIGNFVPAFNFGFTVRDSAYIGTLHGPRSAFPFPRPRKPGFPNGFTFDSSTLNIIGDSASDSGKSGRSIITLLRPLDSTDSSTNLFLNYDSARFTRLVVNELDSASKDSAVSRALSNMDSGLLSFPLFKLPNMDSLFDSIPDLRPGIGGDSVGRVTYHGDLTAGFQFVTLFGIYESDATNIAVGGYLLSQHDSDDHAL